MTKFKYRILLKLRKKEKSYGSKNPLTIKKFVLSVLPDEKKLYLISTQIVSAETIRGNMVLKNHIKHYRIFKIRYSKFVIFQNLFMGYQVQKWSLNKITLCVR